MSRRTTPRWGRPRPCPCGCSKFLVNDIVTCQCGTVYLAEALLIAAAPALLEACQKLIAWERGDDDRECRASIGHDVRLAVARAIGDVNALRKERDRAALACDENATAHAQLDLDLATQLQGANR